jgi:hypothetical protein
MHEALCRSSGTTLDSVHAEDGPPITQRTSGLTHMKTGHEAENQFHRDAVAGLRREYDQTRDRLAVLLDLRLDKSITADEYDRKARELKERQTEIALRIEQHQKGEGDFFRCFSGRGAV